MSKYNYKKIESKWQEKWSKDKLYQTGEDKNKPKYYLLDMFPYPSGAGLHVGHPKGYIATDIIARMKMMQGYNVLHPMGWDAFGLPAENYAIKNKVHPSEAVKKNVKVFKNQLEKIGFTYDWDREINTTDPSYYKWTQWAFLKMLEKGLAFQSEEPIIWCPSCQTGLAMEDLEDGKCERCGSEIERKPMRQWVLRITDYADRLLKGLDELDEWPESIKEMQRNWIGRSEGAEVVFNIKNEDNKIKVFTTRPDTLFGATFLVLAPEHPLVEKITTEENKQKVLKYRKQAAAKSDLERAELQKDKTGVFTGAYAINPVNGKKIPIWIADYVLMNYGTGAIMSVPAHDQRDFDFAKQHNIEIINVIESKSRKNNCVLVHGSSSSKQSDESKNRPNNERHWFSWLKQELQNSDWQVENPLMPKNWEPDYNEWKKEFKKVKVDEDSTLIGHSAGAAFLVRWLGETKKRINKLILVAPGKNKQEGNERLHSFYDFEINPEIKNMVNEICIICSDNDEDYRLDNAKNYYKKLGGRFIVLKNKGHFVEKDMDTNEFPELLDIVLEKDKANTDIENGVMINSDQFNGLPVKQCIEQITSWLEKNNLGRATVNYKLQDWVFSRQRYWGEPIPVIHCQKCGTVPVPEKDLPVELPEVESYEPTGTGESPLAGIDDWVNTKCPKCGGSAKRETNTMPQWAGSNWYYLRYIDPKNDQALVDPEKEKYWMPVDFYVGGAEHATRHLIYARFWHKFLYDIDVVNHKEPFIRLQNVGLIMAEDGRKMSKRWGNVINPDDIIKDYGADALRVYEMFMGPFEQAAAWDTNGLRGVKKFLDKVFNIAQKDNWLEKDEPEVIIELHKTIKKVTKDIDSMDFNTAVAQMMIFINMIQQKGCSRDSFAKFLQVLAPFAPHLSEELWENLQGKSSLFLSEWPEYDEEKTIEQTVEIAIQVNGKLRETIKTKPDIKEEELKEKVLQLEKVKKFVHGQEIKKVIYVKGRLINIVAK